MPKNRVIRIMSCRHPEYGDCHRLDVISGVYPRWKQWHVSYSGKEEDYLPTVRKLAEKVTAANLQPWNPYLAPHGVTIEYRDWPF